ncbi:hypothetical protein [Fuerstiella marisgermanici]|uniref:Uncharacterized protein n=1 Tax=Fuerstiella marisgermanici TaxID=1891926 RepID=A0A1P8WNM5_9PLAN|nr:hypothetical protein [Fuerstiella marisgermanici]APZ95666.1 hypothetical protein Fuma_05325 [Fuerstiella marisgermanici]
MNGIDFSRSFLRFRIDSNRKPPGTVSHKPPYSLNNARIQLECCCDIVEKSTGTSQRFVLGASCKTERVGVDRDIWTTPNADFAPIFAVDRFLNIKTYACVGMDVPLFPEGSGQQTDRQTGLHADVFDETQIDIVDTPAEVLPTAEDIVQAILNNELLVARTRLETARYVATLEYPVKTINANERDNIYQTDTGPILLPDLEAQPSDLISGFDLAYSAFNCADWIELLVRVPTEVDGGINVYHYSKSVRWTSQNQILRIL